MKGVVAVALSALVLATLSLGLHWPKIVEILHTNETTFIVLAALLTAAATVGMLIHHLGRDGPDEEPPDSQKPN